MYKIFLLKVITRFSGSRFDDQIECIMTKRLDYRAGSLIWLTQEAIALISNELNKRVLTTPKRIVGQLHKKQPIQYSVIGGEILSFIMPNFSERLVYYLRYSLNVAGYMIFPNSTPISDFPGFYLQNGHFNHTSMRFSRPDTLYYDYTNDQFVVGKSNQRSCKYRTSAYGKQFEQDSSTDFKITSFIKVSGSKDSSTKIKRCKSSGSYLESNVDDARKMEQECVPLSSCQSSCIYQDPRCFQGIVKLCMKHAETENKPTLNPSNNSCVSRNQTNNLFNTSDHDVSQSDLNENYNCLTKKRDHEPVIAAKNNAQNVISDLKHDLIPTLLLCVACIISFIVYPNLRTIFKSKLLAAIFTFIIVLFYSVLIFYFYIEYI